ncbi:MAG: M23 family metallopeptidase [Bacteroidetes bacterium]|nr:M23 family metallopeptidase [Bacteroidota bacterium]MCB0844991.1 M23 family metallopeptidase [Bacteroidota bacterium]
MAKKIRYYYDAESCTFEEEQITVKSVVRKVLSYASVSGLIACLGLALYFFVFEDPKTAYLKSLNQKLEFKIKEYDEKVAFLEVQVNDLHSKDNQFYRSLMNSDEIDDGYWNGGIGGAANINKSAQPEVLRNAETRLDQLDNKIKIQNKSYDVLFSLLTEKEDELRHTPAIKPVPGRIISGFGMRMHPIHGFRKMHTGLDMQASTGTPVHASGDGTIKLAGTRRGGYGKQVEIDHGGYGYVTKYAHLSKILVTQGQKVKRGEVIGYSGNTGLSKGPHLHYEIIKNDKKIDPIDYFYGDQTPDDYVKLREQAKQDNESLD